MAQADYRAPTGRVEPAAEEAAASDTTASAAAKPRGADRRSRRPGPQSSTCGRRRRGRDLRDVRGIAMSTGRGRPPRSASASRAIATVTTGSGAAVGDHHVDLAQEEREGLPAHRVRLEARDRLSGPLQVGWRCGADTESRCRAVSRQSRQRRADARLRLAEDAAGHLDPRRHRTCPAGCRCGRVRRLTKARWKRTLVILPVVPLSAPLVAALDTAEDLRAPQHGESRPAATANRCRAAHASAGGRVKETGSPACTSRKAAGAS